jgi:hypothetical protein
MFCEKLKHVHKVVYYLSVLTHLRRVLCLKEKEAKKCSMVLLCVDTQRGCWRSPEPQSAPVITSVCAPVCTSVPQLCTRAAGQGREGTGVTDAAPVLCTDQEE